MRYLTEIAIMNDNKSLLSHVKEKLGDQIGKRARYRRLIKNKTC